LRPRLAVARAAAQAVAPAAKRRAASAASRGAEERNMPRLVEALGLRENPFEHYVAETEPNIAEYAVETAVLRGHRRASEEYSFVRPIRRSGRRKKRNTTHRLQGAVGRKAAGERVPLVANMTDFTAVLQGKKLHGLSESALVKEVAFVVIESLLAWLSSLEDNDRAVFLGAMTDQESSLCYQLLRDHYVPRPEAKRSRSAREAMQLLNQAFLARNKLWVERRWDQITSMFGKIIDGLSKKHLDVSGFAGEAAGLIAKKQEEGFDSILLLHRLVDLVGIFDFSGVVVLIDKVDETEATSNSADQTAALIHPLLSRVQLMEIKGFSWIFFLWSRVKGVFESAEYPVRLDKIGHATVSWGDDFFALMLDKRVSFFSESRYDFSGLFSADVDVQKLRSELVRIAMRSPRELIRLMDVIIREHDISNAEKAEVALLDSASVESGFDKYVSDVVSTVYGERLLAQIFRLNKSIFTNKDVQLTFRVGAQSARTRIQSWESAGIIKLTGTRAAEGAQGGKPANEYTIVDARVERVMRRQLVAYAEAVQEEPEFALEPEQEA
jgi:hypothetical protein